MSETVLADAKQGMVQGVAQGSAVGTDLAAPGGYVLPRIVVRIATTAEKPYQGVLTIGDWSVPCASGRGGLVDPAAKREGDGATPIGCFPLRYGFFDPEVFGPEPRALAFPFVEKPADYDWVEDPDSPFYNRMVLGSGAARARRENERLFDMFLPIGWNDATPARGAGSAIYLHAARPDMTPTAGCIAVAHGDLMDLARRLRPGMVIDIAPLEAPADRGADQGTALATPALASAPQEGASGGEPPELAQLLEQPGLAALDITRFAALRPGPALIVTGTVHGNEPCGARAINRVIADFRAGAHRLRRGSVTFVPVMNPLAQRQNTREGMRNLNRDLGPRAVALDYEDHLANVICPLLARHDLLVDLHSFQAPGQAFVLVGPRDNDGALEPFARAREERALAAALGLELIAHGWMQAHARAVALRAEAGIAGLSCRHGVGTTEYMRSVGGAAVTVECGQHLDPQAPLLAERVILNALSHLRMIDRPLPPPPQPRVLRIAEPILARAAQDRLNTRFATGTPVQRGQVIGTRADGSAIEVGSDGALIFAGISAAPGQELAFLCREEEAL